MDDKETEVLPPEFAGFFENAMQGQLAFPYCRSCHQFHWYPMPRCPHCRGNDLEWRQVEGCGSLISFTRVLHPFDSSRANDLPYVVALVQFSDAPGITFVTNIVGDGNKSLAIGQSVEPIFRRNACGKPMVEFRTV